MEMNNIVVLQPYSIDFERSVKKSLVRGWKF